MTTSLEQFFFDQVHKANGFLVDAGCEETDEQSEWQISVEYENELIRVRHTFGDRDSLFNTIIRLKEEENREYGLWEFLDAMGKRTEKKITDNLISDEGALFAVIQNSADHLKENLDLIIHHDEKVLVSMDSARDKVRKAWEAKWK